MDELSLLVDLHRAHPRQGPGSVASTRLAVTLAGLDSGHRLRIADIGCGTGAAALVLADDLDADVVAVDLFDEFLTELMSRATGLGLADRIETLCASMDALPFDEAEFDVVWSEGAIYNIGFGNGISAWRRLLKPGGILVASEITWLTGSRPSEIEDHWLAEYAEIDTASAKMAALEAAGYSPFGYFVLPTADWREEYYAPILADLDEFVLRHRDSELARGLAAAERAEAQLYERYREFFGYGVYLARRVD